MVYMRFQAPLSVVTPALDGEILSVLAKDHQAFTIPQLETVLSDRSREGVRKSLNRLVGEGLVEREVVGRTGLYRLNADHLAAGPVIEIVRSRERFVAMLANDMERWPSPPVFAALFGSAAYGQMRTDSDIDIFLITPDSADPDIWEEQLNDLLARASRWVGNDVRPLVFTEKDVTGLGAREPVLKDVLTQGVVVFGHTPEFAGTKEAG